MIDTIVSVGGKLINFGIDTLKNYLDKRKKEKEALITLKKLNQQIDQMERRWKELRDKLL